MSVFAGGCDLDALTSVAIADDRISGQDPLDLVAELQDVSLIRVTEGADGEPRLAMLETIREYALERLAEAGDEAETRLRHAAYFAEFAEGIKDQLTGPAQLTALDRLEAEHDNLRAALAWSLETMAPAAGHGDRDAHGGPGERAALGLRLAQALAYFWYQHGHATEGRQWLERAMSAASAGGGEPLAEVTQGLGVLLDELGQPEMAREMFERSLAVRRELGDRHGEARALNSLGIVMRHLGDIGTARALLEESIAIARELGDSNRLAASLANLGQLESAAGRFGRAIEVLREALPLDEQSGNLFGVAADLQSLALLELRAGHPHQAWDTLMRLSGYVASSGNTSLLENALETGCGDHSQPGRPHAGCPPGWRRRRHPAGIGHAAISARSRHAGAAPGPGSGCDVSTGMGR
jgi:tetratricopeptide (TPR) repeat protein